MPQKSTKRTKERDFGIYFPRKGVKGLTLAVCRNAWWQKIVFGPLILKLVIDFNLFVTEYDKI